MKKGQRDAAIEFSCFVDDHGSCAFFAPHRRSANSESIVDEAQAKCAKVNFIPAVYHGATVPSFFTGTLVFQIRNGQPSIRIFQTQEKQHIKREDDFVSPQVLLPPGGHFEQFNYPPDVKFGCIVFAQIDTDAAGKLTKSKIVLESRPGLGYAASVMRDLHNITFSPAYLHGKPVAATTTLHIVFSGRDSALP